VPYVPGRLGTEPVTDQMPASPPPWTTGSIPVQPQPPAPQPPQRTGLLAAVLVVVVLVAAAAGVGGFLLLRSGKTPVEAVKAATGPGPYRITGSVSLARGYDGASSACYGKGGYADIRAGAQVVISDSAGATIAVGSLDAGTVTSGRGCVLPFSVPGVPSGKGFYGIEVSHRGVLKYNESEFVTRNLELTLG
jgi:hypothetical protein